MSASGLPRVDEASSSRMDRAAASRERVRKLIRAELARHHPKESAGSALALLAETRLMLDPADSGSIAAQTGDELEAAVRSAVEEVRLAHPRLFAPAGESRAPDPSMQLQPGNRDWLLVEPADRPTGGRMRDQPSTERGEAPAQQLDGAPISYTKRVRQIGRAVAAAARRFRRRSPSRDSLAALQPAAGRTGALAHRPPPSRYIYAAVAAVLALAFIGALWPSSEDRTLSALRATTADNAKPRPAREPAATGAVPSSSADAAAGQSSSAAPQAVTGPAEVIDTATLKIDGKVVRLFGVEWAKGGQAEDLTRYLAGREVDCQLATDPDVYRCSVGLQDLSKVVLFNGGGRATADATPELVDAQKRAQAEQIGVWRKQP